MAETKTSVPTSSAKVGASVDPQFRLAPAFPPRRQASAPLPPSAVEPSPRHRPPWPVFVLLLVISGVGWWVLSSPTASPWIAQWGSKWGPQLTALWAQAPGPLVASGTLEADEVLVGSEVAGRILELVSEGQNIGADELVARLDDALIQVQIRQADLATRQRLTIQADRYLLRTPIAGVVTRVPMHRGEIVSPGQTVAAIADLTVLDLTVYMLERDLGQVRIGQTVTVTVDPFPERTFHGVVTATNPRAEFTPRNVQTKRDRLNLVFGVQIRVENADGALKPGMPADATFPE